jgi:NTP pyrophosphatase (non-canonical NTP hydrolase)
MINQLAKEITANATEKGFWDRELIIPEKLMLIVSEISEAMEADRKAKFAGTFVKRHRKEFKDDEEYRVWFATEVKDTFEDELADACIRIFDLANYMGVDIEYHIKAKMKYNEYRPKMHGGKKY